MVVLDTEEQIVPVEVILDVHNGDIDISAIFNKIDKKVKDALDNGQASR